MSLPQVVSRDEWLVARKGLLAKEKEATRARDAQGTGYYFAGEEPSEQPGTSFFPARGRQRLPHLLYVRPGRGDARRLVPLDLTALGRQEDWEEPKGRAAAAHDASPDFSG